MAGLRERKKQSARRAILDAARRLMARDGYDATTIEAVARRADLSVGTVYNHFDNKRALLLGVLSRATRSVLEDAAPILDRPGDDACAAVSQLLHLYVDAMRTLGRDLLRHAIGISFIEPASAGADMLRLDELMMQQTAALVGALRARGSISTAISTEQATLAIYGTFAVAMTMWIAMPQLDEEGLHRSIDEQLRALFLGLAPRS